MGLKNKAKAKVKADLQRRLDNCLLLQPGNTKCADCPERKPTWASFLITTPGDKKNKKAKKTLAILCCYKCVSYHYQLGRDVCEVKNTKIVDDCKYKSSTRTSDT